MIVTDRTGRKWRIQDCCGMWDRLRDFHHPSCRFYVPPLPSRPKASPIRKVARK